MPMAVKAVTRKGRVFVYMAHMYIRISVRLETYQQKWAVQYVSFFLLVKPIVSIFLRTVFSIDTL